MCLIPASGYVSPALLLYVILFLKESVKLT